ncbi:MAG: YggS family pyridoxal phosphate-dependent enzyme [Ferruginibacter sp.]
MPVNLESFISLQHDLGAQNIVLVAVSKFKSLEDIMTLYDLGQRDFGENFVQELLIKKELLPKDIRWHYIGHLQTNKVKYIVPFIHLIHGVDSLKLLSEINKQALKAGLVVNCLLQVHIAEEETKFGFNEEELLSLNKEDYSNVQISGLMGMASFSDDANKVMNEFKTLKSLYEKQKTQYKFIYLSMGMSGDYKIAIQQGSNMVRIGSIIFGERNK